MEIIAASSMYSQKTAPNPHPQALGSQLKGPLSLEECMNWWQCLCDTFHQTFPKQIAVEISLALRQKQTSAFPAKSWDSVCKGAT